MQFMKAYVYPVGTFILARDRKETPHGIFCWSAEQIAQVACDWRFSEKDEHRLGKLFLAEHLQIHAKQDPQLIHGIGAALIADQFTLLQEVREITKPGTTVPLTQGRIYYRAHALNRHERDAALLFYVTPEGLSTLAHVSTKDQAAELLFTEDWMQETGRKLIEGTINILPEHNRFNQHPVFIHGDLIQQLITAQVIYKQFFPEDQTAQN